MTSTEAYRARFAEYAGKFEALERLRASGTSDGGQIETALLEVEEARVAYSRARDLLASELFGPALPPVTPVGEGHIRDTAQLLWELTGRPDGTAEYDWRTAERLIHKAAAVAR